MYSNYIIDTDAKIETIDLYFENEDLDEEMFYARNKIFEIIDDPHEVTQTIYTLFCDIISIDFKSLAEDLYKIPQEINYDSQNTKSKYELGELIFKRLYQENKYLCSPDIFNTIFTRMSLKYESEYQLNDLINYGAESIYSPIYTEGDVNDRINFTINSHRDMLNTYFNDYRDVLSAFNQIIYFKNYVDSIIDGNEQLNNLSVLLKFIQHYEEGMLSTEFLKSKKSLKYDDKYLYGTLDFEFFLQEVSEKESVHEYSCNSITEILSTSLLNIVVEHLSLKKCKHCGKYFVAFNRSDTKYCERLSKEDPNKTCREYASYINYLDKNKSDMATKLYRSIYNSLGNKYRRTQNDKIKIKIKKLQEVNKQWKLEVKKGNKTEEEYIEWLKSLKEGG